MITLILILGQILFLGICLKIIFSLIDKFILLIRRLSIRRIDRTPLSERMMKARYKKNEVNRRLSKIERKSFKPSRKSSASYSQLLSRLRNDSATAERLINNLKDKYPGHTEKWYIEKAIYDLDRDRRR